MAVSVLAHCLLHRRPTCLKVVGDARIMKRFIVMPGVVLLVVVLLSLSFTLQTRKVQASLNLPRLPESLIPGQFMPPGTPCYRGRSDLGQSYCHPEKDIDIVIKDGRIVRAYMFTYPSGITIGQLIIAWG